MGTNIEFLWIFALVSKCKNFTSINLISLFLLVGLFWFFISLIYWAHPGGPAWGKQNWKKNSGSATIPGPKGIPVFGSMSLMSGLAHHNILSMAKAFKAKRLMAFSLGETKVIVTCNPDVAKEILTSPVFANRPVQETAYGLMFNRAIGFAPYGVYWQTLRRISAVHLFSPQQIKSSANQRSEIVDEMVGVFREKSGCIRVRDVLNQASLNNMMWAVFGNGYKGDTQELRELVDEGYKLLSMVNWSDHFSWLSGFDPQKIRFRCSSLVPKVNRFVSRIIDEHRGKTGRSNRDFVDVLLSLEGSDKLSESDMIAVLWEMIFRGTDTVAVLMEWILARMVLHPDVQSKVQNELDMVVGKSRAVTESDITEMVYLPAVVKEVIRLHPPGPLLAWSRYGITDTKVDGFHVPAGTTAMVNMWAIMRDPQVWADPLSFIPERFINNGATMEFSIMGSDPRLAPFGSGRRSCPGKTLGLTTTTFWIASLLHEFELGTFNTNAPDLSEVLGLSCEMANPLTVTVRSRR